MGKAEDVGLYAEALAADIACQKAMCHRSDCNGFLCLNALDATILAERERCAHVADTHGLDGGSDFCQGCGEEIAAAIRKGSD